MLALLTVDRLTLYRRRGRKMELWRVITGDPPHLTRALRVAQELAQMASAAGGWGEPLVLGLDPSVPVPPRLPRRLRLDDADGVLRVLHQPRGGDGP